MEITLEQLLQLYGESQVSVRLLEKELNRLLQENAKLRGEASPPLEKPE